jgi:phosphoesterase RecJ-like protein
MLLDCQHLDRVGPVAQHLSGEETVVVVDHHPPDDLANGDAVSWVVEESAATACLVHSLIHAMDATEMDAEKATCLYVALLTDTGGFRFSNTTSDALLAAADLARHGADPATLSETFLHRRRPQTLRLLSRVLESAQYHLEGRVVLLTVDQSLLVETGGLMTETEGFVNFFTSAEGVDLVAMFKEDRPGRWRVSLRANDRFQVHEMAARFGGGGHRKAAGFEAPGDLEDLQALVLAEFETELARGKARS